MLFCACLSLFASGEDTIVFITKTGKKYHLSSCSTLRSSSIAITLEEAVARGYEPCTICHPPLLYPDQVSQLYQVNLENLTSYKEADIARMTEAFVLRVIDGDTIKVTIDNPPKGLQATETVRLLGVDTPETVHPSKPVEFFGKEAGAFTRTALEGKQVYLAFDWDLRDDYQRVLAYVYLEDGSCHNANIIFQGYGYAYLTYPFQFMEEFSALEDLARLEKRGLWE